MFNTQWPMETTQEVDTARRHVLDQIQDIEGLRAYIRGQIEALDTEERELRDTLAGLKLRRYAIERSPKP